VVDSLRYFICNTSHQISFFSQVLLSKQKTMGFFSNLFGGGPVVDFKEMVHNGAVIIDVRTPEEFKSGHIPQSQNIPLQILQQKINDVKKKNKPVIACCASGGRSSMATTLLQNAGIEAVNGGGWHSLQSKLR
jgi:rhodanese-related sulfurtransferase